MKFTWSCIAIPILLIILISCSQANIIEYYDATIDNDSKQEEPTSDLSHDPGVDEADIPIRCPEIRDELVTNREILMPPSLPEPSPRVPFVDPIFRTCIMRITDRSQDLPSSSTRTGLKNEYSRVQSFNSDESLLLLYGTNGEWMLYDVSSFKPVGELPLGVEPRWDSEDPHVIYHIDETHLLSFNLNTMASVIVHDFSLDLPDHSPEAVWMRYEGRPSMDTRYWGLMAENQDWIPTAFLIYDRHTDQVIIRDIRNTPGVEDDIDHVTISPLGKYFLASFDRHCPDGQLGNDAIPCGLMVYDSELKNGRGLLRTIGHYDPSLDADGNEVIIYQDIDNDSISMLEIESGDIIHLFPIDFSHTPIGFHFSGLAYEHPGWALISTYSGGYPEAFTWMDDQVIAVELKDGGRIVRFAHTHSLVDSEQNHDYWAEPQATVNKDFSKILFASNWGRSGTEEIETFLIIPPEGWND